MNLNQQFQVSQSPFRNFITPFSRYHYLPENEYEQINSIPSIIHWLNLMNYSPNNDHSTDSKLNQQLISPNYLLPMQGQRPFIYWYHPGFGLNLQRQYDEYNDNDDESSNFHSRRRINGMEFFKNVDKNNFSSDDEKKTKIDRSR